MEIFNAVKRWKLWIWPLSGFLIMMAFGWLVFPELLYQSIDQPVQFSHKVHTGDAVGQTCEDCHAFRDDGIFAGIPMNVQCSACHSEQVGDSPHEKLFVEEFIKQDREVPWLVYARQPQNVYFSHAPHVKLAQIPCQRCHGLQGESESLRPLYVNRISGYSRDIWGSSIARFKRAEWDGMKMDDCADCHEERGVENNCLLCHK